MLDVMIDLETMGNGPDAAIIAIGAVEFDPDAQLIGERLDLLIDLASAVAAGGAMDAATVLWWMRQDDLARSDVTDGPHDQIGAALIQFSKWLAQRAPQNDLRIWGNGSDFDNVILASAYRRLSLPLPWRFWGNRCYRTLKAMRPDIPFEHVGTRHNAIDDAESQARHLMGILSALRGQAE